MCASTMRASAAVISASARRDLRAPCPTHAQPPAWTMEDKLYWPKSLEVYS